MTIGERIRECRRNANITQKELGNRLGVSQQQIAQYEKGVRIPRIETLKKLASALNVTLIAFLDDELLDTDLGDIDLGTDDTTILLEKRLKDILQSPDLNEAERQAKIAEVLTSWEIINDSRLKRSTNAKNLLESQSLCISFDQLNTNGRAKVLEYVAMLTKISEYRKEPISEYSKQIENYNLAGLFTDQEQTEEYSKELMEFLYHNVKHKKLFDASMEISTSDVELATSILHRISGHFTESK